MVGMCAKIFRLSPSLRQNELVENEYNSMCRCTYCVRSVNAALVMLDGRCRPLIISCHNFLLMTSTNPPRAITKLYNSYKSNTDFAMMGNRFIGEPGREQKKGKMNIKNRDKEQFSHSPYQFEIDKRICLKMKNKMIHGVM